ncbi:MAG: protein kinase, partial [Thermoanaerobaculia bacterium]
MSSTDDPNERLTSPSRRPAASDLESLPTQVTPTEGPHFTPGTLIANRYRVVRMLGVGGMGVVYRVHDQTVDLELALKVLRPEIARDAGFLQRFRNELLAARQVTHRNVVRIHDIGEHEGLYYMSMDLVEGRSLQEVLKEERTLGVERAAAIVRQIADALAEAHRQEVVHRDLKPGNIMIDAVGNAYVTDFGIARSLTRPGLTRTGEVLGTPDYLSPEQARGEVVDGRSDLYSLGLMFVEMLSGKLPFPGGTLYEVLAQRMTGKMQSLTELGVKVSPAHAAIIRRCVAKEAGERYQSASELIADLDDLSRPRRLMRLRRLRKVATAVVALLVAGLAVFAVSRWMPPRLDSTDTTDSPPAVEAPAAVKPRFAVAVLPFPEESGREDLQWASTGIAEILAASLAESEDLRVVDSLRVFQMLKDLGFDPNRLRDDQIDQLADVFQVNRLVRGRLRSAGERVQIEVNLVETDQPGSPVRQIGSSHGDVGDLFELVDDLGATLRQTLEVPRTETAAVMLTPSEDAMRAYSEGLGFLARGEVSEALPALEQAVAKDPDFTTAWVRLAEAYRDLGRQEEALDAAKQGVRAAGASSGRRAYEARAQEALLRGKPEEAQQFLQDLVERYPNDVEARIGLAKAFGQQGSFGEAMVELRRVAEIDSGAPEAWYLLGQYAIRSGDSREAVDNYLVQALILRKKTADEMGQAEVYNAMGVGFQRLGLPAQASENYEEAAEIRRRIDDRRGLAATLTNLGWIYLTQGDFDAA